MFLSKIGIQKVSFFSTHFHKNLFNGYSKIKVSDCDLALELSQPPRPIWSRLLHVDESISIYKNG